MRRRERFFVAAILFLLGRPVVAETFAQILKPEVVEAIVSTVTQDVIASESKSRHREITPTREYLGKVARSVGEISPISIPRPRGGIS